MAYNLSEKIALVTGAASGIGEGVVQNLLNENVKHVAMLDIDEEKGKALESELNVKYKENRVSFIKCDVTDKEQLLEAFKKVKDKNGCIDLVVNSAGILNDTMESFDMEIKVNVTALITSSLHAWNVMHKERGGSGGTIINFSSVAAIDQFIFAPIYSATKSAVLKFSRALGHDAYYSKSGVRVITMCFGETDTPILKNIHKVFDESVQEQNAQYFSTFQMQSRDSASKAVIQVCKQGASGSVWISTSDKPAIDISETYDKSIELFHDYVYDKNV